MALPRLQLRKGTTAPSGSIALVAEPFFDTTNKNLYVADSASTFVHIGGTTYTSRIDEFLTASIASTSVGSVTLKDAQATQNSVTIDVPSTVTTSYSFTLPPDAGTDGYILKTDGSGNTTWIVQASGFANWVLSDGTTTQTINSTDTVTVSGGSGISSTVSATDTVTIDLNIDELTALDAEGGADPLVVGDSIAVYDTSATGNKKVTIGNLETVIFADVSGDITIAANGTAAIGSGVIVDGDISATAEIAVSKLADGSARQLLQTDAAGTGVEWASNIDVPGTLDVTGKTTLDGDLDVATALTTGGIINIATGATSNGNTKTVNIGTNGVAGSTTSITIGSSNGTSSTTILGDLTVTGSTTTVNTTNTLVSDSLIELANGTTGTPTADAGIVIERGDLSNVFVGYDEGADVFVVGTTTITGSGTDAAPSPITFLAGALNITDTAGTNEAVIGYVAADGLYSGSAAGRYIQNVTLDFGTY